MTVHLEELNAEMPTGYIAIFADRAKEYIVVTSVGHHVVMRRHAGVVDTWRDGKRGAVMASSLRHLLRREEIAKAEGKRKKR